MLCSTSSRSARARRRDGYAEPGDVLRDEVLRAQCVAGHALRQPLAVQPGAVLAQRGDHRHKLYAGGVPTRSWSSVHKDDEDSDADEEHDGREVTGAEDDFMAHGYSGPGCPISDPGGCEHDGCEPEHDGGEEAYHTLSRYGVDQRKGPLNEREARRAHYAEQMREPAAVRS